MWWHTLICKGGRVSGDVIKMSINDGQTGVMSSLRCAPHLHARSLINYVQGRIIHMKHRGTLLDEAEIAS
jgi:hypothetical protein